MQSIYDLVKEKMQAVDDVLFEWLQSLTTFTVVKTRETDFRPKPPYISYYFSPMYKMEGSRDEEIPELDNTGHKTGRKIVRCFRKFSVSIEAVGIPAGDKGLKNEQEKAGNILTAVDLSIDLSQTMEILSKADLAIMSREQIISLDKSLETEIENRSMLEVFCSIRFDLIDEPGYFDTVEIQGLLDTDFNGTYDKDTGILTNQ